MLTPAFTVKQDDTTVTVVISAPHVRTSNVEIDVQDNRLWFHAKPYFLRLTFPGRLLSDDDEPSGLVTEVDGVEQRNIKQSNGDGSSRRTVTTYNVDAGEFTVVLTKAQKCEHFKDLDLYSKLLATSSDGVTIPAATVIPSAQKSDGRPLIVDLDAASTSTVTNANATMTATAESHVDDDEEEEEEVELNWEIEQTLPETSTNEPRIRLSREHTPDVGQRYGFNGQFTGYLAAMRATANEANEIISETGDATADETLTVLERRKLRIERENASFDAEHYAFDYMNDEDDIVPIIKWMPSYRRGQSTTSNDDKDLADQLRSSASISRHNNDSDWTAEERRWLQQLPRRTYLISDARPLYLGLIDILFAYCYDMRLTLGDHSVESAWTIAKLSCGMAGLETFADGMNIRTTLIASFRRALTNPLYRHWELCETIQRDIACILGYNGSHNNDGENESDIRKSVLCILLRIRDILSRHDIYYVYARMLVDHYCVWIQTGATENALRSLGKDIAGIELEKDETGWDLDEIEDAALATTVSSNESEDQNVEQEDIDQIPAPVAKVEIEEPTPAPAPATTTPAMSILQNALRNRGPAPKIEVVK
ncbi:SHQ1-domain-containing protein [Ramicandelaber brevisporus]|nr:SHQ1-domain-containing protein [Ramicandelaber brevisporus]